MKTQPNLESEPRQSNQNHHGPFYRSAELVAGVRKYQSKVGSFNRFLRDNAQTARARVTRGEAGRPLAQSSCSSAQRRWPLSNSCSKSGSMTAISSAPVTNVIPLSGAAGRRSRVHHSEGAGETPSKASKPSTCFAAVSTSSCRACRRWNGFRRSWHSAWLALRDRPRIRKLRGSNISYRPAANNRGIGEIKCILYANYGNLVNPHPPR
jgi:hypothetical protein